MRIKRNRIIYGVLILLTIVLGLCSRTYSDNLPYWIGAYSGDTLWGLMIFLMIGFLFTVMKTRHVAVISILLTFIIETSQLYHALWIDAIRRTLIGGLILGYGFLWSDLICYTIGILIGVLIEKFLCISFHVEHATD
ncbi:MAG: DUF2809 domain-containing protein [Eubacteriales bacterium]|nr:DUF2809 domain-containing protein [Eubacteriales bacterium]